MVSLMSREFHDSTWYRGSKNAVATTWLVSYSDAADLLSFMSRTEPKAIPPPSILPGLESESRRYTLSARCVWYSFLTKRGTKR